MNWETILKKRRWASLHFKEIREALLKIVENMESGDRFKMVDLKNELVEALRKEKTTDNKNYNRGLTHFSNDRIEMWLKMTGTRILNSANLIEDKGPIKVRL